MRPSPGPTPPRLELREPRDQVTLDGFDGLRSGRAPEAVWSAPGARTLHDGDFALRLRRPIHHEVRRLAGGYLVTEKAEQYNTRYYRIDCDGKRTELPDAPHTTATRDGRWIVWGDLRGHEGDFIVADWTGRPRATGKVEIETSEVNELGSPDLGPLLHKYSGDRTWLEPERDVRWSMRLRSRNATQYLWTGVPGIVDTMSADGSLALILTGFDYQTGVVVDSATGRARLAVHSERATSWAFEPDGDLLVSVSTKDDRTAIVRCSLAAACELATKPVTASRTERYTLYD